MPNKIYHQWRWLQKYASKQPISVNLFILLCLNLVLAPAVQAAAGGQLSTSQVFWLIILGLVTLSLSAYLFAVIFQPERF